MPETESDLVIFPGNSSKALVKEICDYLEIPVGRCEVGKFSDGEIQIEIEENVRGRDVFLVQSTSTPVNDHLMELLIMIDAARRASAQAITAVVPYFGYARQDRKVAPRTPITARLVADLITSAGADRFLSMDLHAGQIQGFFDMPSDHLYASPILLEDMKRKYGGRPDEVVVVSPDAGGVERARAFAKRLGATLAIVDKRRPKANVAEVMQIVGDVRGKTAIMLDDMIDTAGTLTLGAKALVEAGARRIVAYAVHPVLSGPAIERLQASAIEEVVVTNTIPLRDNAVACKKITQLSVAKIFGEAIRRIHSGDSLSSLFV
ncbi:MAG TPA: ribose-phosphate pyrophosphokinase [Myxococcales bacterium]|nr:ribose-phosphate pyrophosphokinase [Myxococcales bacterium]